MSLQVCHCGWSKQTSYQGLRIHQGKKGCTPKGMKIPEYDQFIFKPSFTYMGRPIKLEESLLNDNIPIKYGEYSLPLIPFYVVLHNMASLINCSKKRKKPNYISLQMSTSEHTSTFIQYSETALQHSCIQCSGSHNNKCQCDI